MTTFEATTVIDAPAAEVWRRLLSLFHGTRDHPLDALAGGRTSVGVRGVYAGPMAPLVTRSIPDLQPSFETFVAGLRRDAEAATADRGRS